MDTESLGVEGDGEAGKNNRIYLGGHFECVYVNSRQINFNYAS